MEQRRRQRSGTTCQFVRSLLATTRRRRRRRPVQHPSVSWGAAVQGALPSSAALPRDIRAGYAARARRDGIIKGPRHEAKSSIAVIYCQESRIATPGMNLGRSPYSVEITMVCDLSRHFHRRSGRVRSRVVQPYGKDHGRESTSRNERTTGRGGVRGHRCAERADGAPWAPRVSRSRWSWSMSMGG